MCPFLYFAHTHIYIYFLSSHPLLLAVCTIFFFYLRTYFVNCKLWGALIQQEMLIHSPCFHLVSFWLADSLCNEVLLPFCHFSQLWLYVLLDCMETLFFYDILMLCTSCCMHENRYLLTCAVPCFVVFHMYMLCVYMCVTYTSNNNLVCSCLFTV